MVDTMAEGTRIIFVKMVKKNIIKCEKEIIVLEQKLAGLKDYLAELEEGHEQ